MLKNGITFEESGIFLKWGVFINPLIQKYNGSKENLGDRTAYNWGKQTILNGLELELSTCFWNFGFQRWFRRFTEIEYSAIGDTIAEEEFKRISSHLIELFGPPRNTEVEINDPEKFLTWEIDKIEFSLYYFQQHCFHLNFTIKKK